MTIASLSAVQWTEQLTRDTQFIIYERSLYSHSQFIFATFTHFLFHVFTNHERCLWGECVILLVGDWYFVRRKLSMNENYRMHSKRIDFKVIRTIWNGRCGWRMCVST